MVELNTSMDLFCGSQFWNATEVWDTNDPDFTPCFENTVLVWAPCLFIWIFSIFEIYYIKTSLDRNIPWNLLNISKLVLNLALLLLTAIDLIVALVTSGSTTDVIYPVDIWTPVVKLATFLLVFIFLPLNKKYGVQTSGCQFLFWFLLVICSIPRCRTEIRAKAAREPNDDDTSWIEYKYISYMIYFALSIAMFILNCFADKMPRDTKYQRTINEIPELSASFLSRVLFSWFDRMAWLGFRKPLEQKDLWDLRPMDSCKEVMPIFAYYWNKNVRKNYSSNRATPVTPKAQYANGKVAFENPHATEQSKKMASIIPPIIRSFGGVFLFGSFMKLIADILVFIQPQVLSLIISFVEDLTSADGEAQPSWHGILYSVLLFIIAAGQTFVLGQYFQRMLVVGLRVRTALINAIYRKALVISNKSRKESTVGEIVNLMAVDAQRFMDLTTYLNMLWSAPLQIILSLVFLWRELGPSVLAGVGIMIIMIPLNGIIANRIKRYQVKQMKYKDDRVKLMNEVLSGIKVLKLYAWEPSFEKQVQQIRDKEIDTLRATAYLNAGTSFLWSCAPFLVSLVTFATYTLVSETNELTASKVFVALNLFDLLKLPMATLPMLFVDLAQVSLVTFATYVLVDENNVLNASKTFVSLSLFNILRFPLSMLPMLISSLVQTQVSVTRINKFLNSEELRDDNVSHDKTESDPIVVQNGNFSWGDEETVLRNINMHVKRGGLCAVVGAVGTGKSSLIQAILGEMDKLSGRVNTVGSIAYVSQQAWIQNASLRENILFGKPFNRKLYYRVIDACALRSDIEMLSAGDKTEIGEKGINLSGGQKQRVSLARAVYNDADIYLLDDPLSAVDSHVGKHIFEEVIGPNGLLAKKTRVLVTHGITFLPQTDNIYVIKDGEVSENGTYQQLLQKKGAFSEFLVQHIQESAEEGEKLDEITKQLEINGGITPEVEKAISLARMESLSDSVSVKSVESGNSLRRRRRLDSQISAASQQSLKKPTESDGKLIEKEKEETGSVKLDVYKHYIKSVGILLAVGTLVLNFAYQGFQIGSNLWLTQWSTDKNVANDTSLRNMYLGVYAAFGLGQVFTRFASALTLSQGCLNCSKDVFSSAFICVLRWPLSIFDTTPMGRILSRFSKDVDLIDSTIPMNLSQFLSTGFTVLATIFVISLSTPIFLAVILPIAVFYYFAQRFYVATSRQLMRLESVSRSPIYSHFNETITGVSTIRAFQVQERFIHDSDEKVDRNQICKYPSLIANRWLAIRLEMVGNFIILFAALFAVLGGQANSGLVGLSVTYALQVTQTLNWLVRMSSEIETNIVSVERIKEYGETKQEAPWEIEGVKVPENWPLRGEVIFENFMVRYREGLDLVLKGISCKINGSEKVGIVGRTGAGKSSLTLALFRIIESSGGRILIDGIDISTLGLHMLRSRLTIIPQDPVLFSGTLRINLDPFETKTDDEIWHALELAHLKPFAKSLSAGLNHEISEGGDNLSVGQRQLVCLARALLRKTKVLILDEATAAVDLETDDLIQKTIRSEFKECTVLTIAHRLNTILDSDKVMVLDKGQIIEFASPNELLDNPNSAFYSMAKDANLV